MSEPASLRRKLLLLLAAGVGVLSLLAGFFVYASHRAGGRPSSAEMFAARAATTGALPEFWKVPAFSFRDQRGQSKTHEALLGRVLIADFIFTTCTSVCPLLTAKMRLLQRALREPNLGFVSFSVDPAHDTPEALARYAEVWNPSETRWTLLSTDPKGLAALADGMRVAIDPSSDPLNPIIHSSLFFLIDRAGMVRGFYDSADEAALARLERDTKTLLGSAAPAAEPAKSGAALYAELGCAPCHDNPKLAPSLAGIAGRNITLQSGETQLADRAYLRESLLVPGQKLAAGYLNLMPAYDKALSSDELDRLLDHLQSLPPAASSSGSPNAPSPRLSASSRPPAPPPTPAASTPAPALSAAAAPSSAAPASLATDPVCKMSVRAAPESLHLDHAGRTYYFCSEPCLKSFRADPERYLGGNAAQH